MTSEPHPAEAVLTETALLIDRQQRIIDVVRHRLTLAGVPADYLEYAVQGYLSADTHVANLSSVDPVEAANIAQIIGYAYRVGEQAALSLRPPPKETRPGGQAA